MSDPEKGGSGKRREVAGGGTAPIRSPSQNLFELDSPATSGMHPLGAGVPAAAPANDAFAPVGGNDLPALDANARESALIDAEFAALANTSELEAPLVAAHEAAAAKEQVRDTHALTHVPADQDFDATLRLPRPQEDAIEARRGRLALRYKVVCAAYKLLTIFDLRSADRREVVELFSNYEARLRAALPPPAEGEPNRDADALHSLLPPPGLDELERALNKLEEKLLSFDDCVSEQDFKGRVSKSKQPIKTLLRYARLLASRRFNIGYRRDRFEFLAVELLTTESSDKRLRLLPRDKAATVLHHLLAGLPPSAAPEERAPATAHLREALDRLAEIGSSKEFFESEFFLDLHGYKISMRDQITCPEFLYLCAALEVELHNRMLDWASAGRPSLRSLHNELEAQRGAAEDVFGNFRRPRSTPAAKSSPRPQPTKEALPQPVPPRRKRKRKRISEEPPDSRARNLLWLKLAAAALVIVVSFSSALYSMGVIQIGKPLVALTPSQLQDLSPLLLRATVNQKQHKLEGLIARPAWARMTKPERRAAGAEFTAKLKAMGIPNARVLAYKTPVIQVEYGTLVYVDDTTLVVSPH